RLEPALQIKAAGQFVGQCLMVDKAVGAGGLDGPFIEAHGIERAALDARDLGADERSAVLEVRGAALVAFLQLAMVSCQSVLVLSTIRGGCRIAERSPGQRGVELVFCQLEGCRHPKKSLSVFCRFDGGSVRTREKA